MNIHASQEGKGRPPTALCYGDQRPARCKMVAQQAERLEDDSLAGGEQRVVGVALLGDTSTTFPSLSDGKPPHKEVWLLARVAGIERRNRPSISSADLPANYTLRRLVRLAKCRWKIEQDYQQLKEELGLDHYEGRSWAGWHHHVTLVMMAHAFLTLETLRGKKNFWVDPAEDAT